jgi:hypothetical protein
MKIFSRNQRSILTLPFTQNRSSNVPISATYLPHIQKHEHVKYGQSSKWECVHEHQVHPRDVDADVSWVRPHLRRHRLRTGHVDSVGTGDGRRDPGDLKKAAQVIADREEKDDEDGDLGAAVRYYFGRSGRKCVF